MSEYDIMVAAGGTPTFVVGAGPVDAAADPAAVAAWNFGLIAPDPSPAAAIDPGLHSRFPALGGKWDGQTTINCHNAVRKVLGADLKAHNQPTGTCFPAGTLVLMGDGTQKAIEDVDIGDEVVTHVGTTRKVLRLVRRKYSGDMYSVRVAGLSAPIEMTDEHPVLITSNGQAPYDKGFRPGKQSWIPARQLDEGMRVFVPFGPVDVTAYNAVPNYDQAYGGATSVLTRKKTTPYRGDTGFFCPIRSIDVRRVDDLPVYNLEVEEEHTYVAGSIAVHNCGGRAGSRGAEILQCLMIGSGKRAKWKAVSHAWLYYLARKKYGMLGRGDGVAGGSIPEVMAESGLLHRAEAGDPEQAGARSDDVAGRWGAGRLSSSEAQAFLKLSSDNLVTARVRVRTAQELADGIASGGVGVGSDSQGYTMERDSDGFCSPRGTWYHYHVRSGVGLLGPRKRKGFAYDQSWGDTTPGGPPLEGWPGNCFGVDWDVQDECCRRGEWDVLFAFDLWDLEQGNVDLSWLI